MSTDARTRVLGELITASHLMTLEQVPRTVSAYAARAGWPGVLIYVSDLQQDQLYLLTGPGGASDDSDDSGDSGGEAEGAPAELAVEGTVAGRAFQIGEVLPASASSTGQWWIPLLDGSERLGVLRVGLPGAAVEADADVGALAGLVALLLVSKRGTSDSYGRLVRRRRMEVAAEMEWRLMPPRTFAADRVLISAIMEPAYEISGDAFDYAVSGDTVHLSVFDAMGHDTAAGLTANLAVATCRKYRRQGADLGQTADRIEQTLTEQFGTSRYTTGILAELSMATGTLSWTSRGHHPPVVIRGRRTIVPLACPPAGPMGTGLGLPTTICHDRLEPGDRLLFFTDGITEARNDRGEEFGLDRLTDFLIRHHADDLSVPETLRRLVRHHLDYHDGRLRDDATVMLVEWHGPTPYSPSALQERVGLPPSITPDDPLATAWSTPPPTPAGS
ncbi:putative serine phosphatase [Actinacidiphila reveromycinica]|uniref:Putative serine phosphatase n=1 Tax=Actinacidiphila reveromycinica TaxID=659352 RepID=A0A7U3UN15_9ACTN|nr:PP2C family protein-serine/threonine phosphatase [Streptomyces sp. SN-593]BBA95566.1 putative serine phosphatase [Streptomyces sp. SN-593]